MALNTYYDATPNARLRAVFQLLKEAGKSLGKICVPTIPEKSHILMTMHAAGVSALEDRLHGEQEMLQAKGITWTVAITGNSPAQAQQVITDELTKHPDIKFILCTGQADTEGAGLAIEKNFVGKGYGAAGFDLSPEILRLIKAGHIRCTIDQQPYIQGYYPVIQLALYKRYGIMPSNMDTGAPVIGPEQADRVLELSRKGYR